MKYSFTPLESPAIYGGDVKRKSSFIIEGGVKAPSFLTGFTFYLKSSLGFIKIDFVWPKQMKGKRLGL